MGFMDWLRRPETAAPKAEPRLMPAPVLRRLPRLAGARTYLAASQDRLTNDLPAGLRSINADVRPALRVMRARSRHLCQNNDYVRHFLRLLRRNVVGANGIALRMKCRLNDGRLDKRTCDRIEAAWLDWCRAGTCTVRGRHGFAEVQRLVLQQAARDGEVLLRHVRDPRRPYGYALQFVAVDLLNEDLNSTFNGSAPGVAEKRADTEIRMAVERDRFGRPVAYHLLTQNPYDDVYSGYAYAAGRYQRLPAEDALHLFMSDDEDQARGVPWLYSAMRRLTMLGGYEEAELVAARVGASKMGFYASQEGASVDLEEIADAEAGDGTPITEADPGTFGKLPVGVDIKTVDWDHPNQGFDKFVKSMLRGASAGLGCSYNMLANDLEGVNYSSLREGNLQDRDEWGNLQTWMIDQFLRPVFENWLTMALTVDAIPGLSLERLDRYDAATWQPRGFAWVDPEKEITAEEKAIGLRVRTRSQICAERGQSFEDILAELKMEQELAAEYGVDLPEPGAAAPAASAPAAAPDDEPAEDMTEEMADA